MKLAAAAQPVVAVITSVTLDSAIYSSAEQTVAGSLTIVIDARDSKKSGWRVVVQGNDFVADQANGVTIAANQFAIASVSNPELVEGKEKKKADASAAPLALPSSLERARTVAIAEPGAGVGLYQQTLGLQLTIPGGARPRCIHRRAHRDLGDRSLTVRRKWLR